MAVQRTAGYGLWAAAAVGEENAQTQMSSLSLHVARNAAQWRVKHCPAGKCLWGRMGVGEGKCMEERRDRGTD